MFLQSSFSKLYLLSFYVLKKNMEDAYIHIPSRETLCLDFVLRFIKVVKLPLVMQVIIQTMNLFIFHSE